LVPDDVGHAVFVEEVVIVVAETERGDEGCVLFDEERGEDDYADCRAEDGVGVPVESAGYEPVDRG